MQTNTAYIDPQARIGKNVSIGMFSIVEADATIGDGTVIGPYCVIESGAIIGEECRLKAYCEVRKGVRIGAHSRLGSRCTLAAGTVVGTHVDIKYGFVSTTFDFSEKVDRPAGSVGDYAMVGVNVTLMPGASIGAHAIVGACSQVRTLVPSHETWFGSPATFYRKNPTA